MTKVGDVLNLPQGSAPDAADGHVVIYADSSAAHVVLPSGEIAVLSQSFPHHAMLFIDDGDYISGTGTNALSLQYPATQPYQIWAFQTATPNVGDRVVWKALLASGTYTVRVIGFSDASYGITGIQINGVTVASFDWYSASAVSPDVKESTTVTIPDSGLKEITMRITGKNALSSSFFFTVTAIMFIRTGA